MARPVADGLIVTGPDGPGLVGGRDRASGRYVFPLPQGPLAERYEAVTLAREGALWSFTVQRFPPKTPFLGTTAPFRPYAVGYVELPGQIIVESRLKTDNFSGLRIGMPMRLTTEVFARATDGEELVTYAFEPIG
jgi:hypothetical protein